LLMVLWYRFFLNRSMSNLDVTNVVAEKQEVEQLVALHISTDNDLTTSDAWLSD